MRVPGGLEPHCADRWRLIEWCAFGSRPRRLAGCRVVFPNRQRNCPWPSQELRPRSGLFLFGFQVRAGLVEDRKMRCALLRQRFAALPPMLPPLPRAGREAAVEALARSEEHTSELQSHSFI